MSKYKVGDKVLLKDKQYMQSLGFDFGLRFNYDLFGSVVTISDTTSSGSYPYLLSEDDRNICFCDTDFVGRIVGNKLIKEE